MLRKIFVILFCFAALCMAGSAEGSVEPVKFELLAEDASVQPGQSFWVALHLDLAEGWHAYWKNPGDAGMAPKVEWTLPEGYKVSDLHWPAPHRAVKNGVVTYGYEHDVLLLAEITPTGDADPALPVEIGADVRWVVCSGENCLPGTGHADVALSLNESSPQANGGARASFAMARKQLPDAGHRETAERQGEQISLKLPGVHFEDVEEAYFCPSQSKMIDEMAELGFAESDEGMALVLKDSSLISSSLDGVAVLVTSDQQLHAYDVKTKITDVAGQSEGEQSLGTILLLAFVGGLILNLMPCVLPVISFKVMSFVNMAGQKRSETLKHGVSFALGVLLSFWVLAGVLLGLQAYGRAVGWGFQLQEPIFVALLGAFLFIFGLSLFGVFELGTAFASKAGEAQVKGAKNEGLFGSFMSGILATAVATPCTGPFLGTAVGFAVTQPAVWAMTIFTSLGLGMAFPYILLGAFPSLLRFLPKPGNWMVTFKEAMGFVMIATVLWLVWVFGAQTSSIAVSIFLVGLFFISIGCWIFGKWGTPVKKKRTRIVSYAAALLLFLMGGYAITSAASIQPDLSSEIAMADLGEGSINRWEPYNAERVAELQARGIPVFVDFTARWCLICQTNHMVLSTRDVSEKFAEKGVVKMSADWTRYDASITEALAKFGRNGVPLYLLYGVNADGSPEILPQVLTPGVVLEALERVENGSH